MPAGLFVLHSCDVPACVRHVYVGTQAENMADKVRRGRAAKGEGHGMVKLTIKQVRAVFRLREQGYRQREIGEKFGICQAHVSDILSGRRGSWRGALKETA